MPKQVCTGAKMTCTMGASPATFIATVRPIITSNMPAGTVMDIIPIVNITPFGMCKSPANPMVAAATAAALGVLTPQPCLGGVYAAPWAPGAPTVQIMGQLALDDVSKLTCMWGGMISFTQAGQTTHEIP